VANGGGQDVERAAGWRAALGVYLEPRVLAMLFLGFSSGLPLALTLGTLGIWFSRLGVDKTTIGLFALVTLPYSLKFFWAPLMDRLQLPRSLARFGRRRGWALATQAALMAAIFGLGQSDPVADPWTTALWALFVAFASASQDIVVDAYRVEILQERQFGAGAAMMVGGYRIGMLVAGAGALHLATDIPWSLVYAVMALLVSVGVVAVLMNPEPPPPPRPGHEIRVLDWLDRRAHLRGWRRALAGWLYGAVLAPFADYMRRPGWWLILLFIALYKFGDSLAGIMSGPFYVELEFSLAEIADITKVFGFGATMVGVFLGGLMVARYGIMRSLFWAGVLQMLSNLMFAAQAVIGHNVAFLALTIGLENMAGGLGTAAFVAYLSALCNLAYTATQYALLTSFMSLARTTLSAPGGWLADATDWVTFFLLTTLAALPGLLLLYWLLRRGHDPRREAREGAG
jgi:MFS transporter, PAT family, beta-lactamase induction signal transducer AmpG